MDMQGALRARLLAAATITTLVGTRVHWMSRPQNDPLPAITLNTVSDGRPKHLKGYQGLRETRVQCDCWAKDTSATYGYSQARALAEAAIAVLSPPQTGNGIRFDHAIADGPRDLGENIGTAFIHRASVDFIIWHGVSE